MDPTIRKIRLSVLDQAADYARACLNLNLATIAERIVYEQQLEQIAAMRTELLSAGEERRS